MASAPPVQPAQPTGGDDDSGGHGGVGDPPFTLDRPRHDMSTFYGRFLHFLDVTNPLSLLNSSETIEEAKSVLKGYRGSGLKCCSDAEMWRYKGIVESAVHPVTQEIIPAPFRVSAIAPINVPLVYAMLICPASNVPGTLFLHWLNQSYNSACNYANRSGESVDTASIAKAYGLAISSACGFAYGMGRLVETTPRLRRLGFIIPALATAMANVSNIGWSSTIVHMYICIHVHTCKCMFPYCMFVYVYLYLYVCVCKCIQIDLNTHLCKYACINVNPCIYTYVRHLRE
jgi:hypothetical protein